MIFLTIFLKKTGQIRKVHELLEKEKAPRCSAGQPNIEEFESANNQNPQQKGETDDITRRE